MTPSARSRLLEQLEAAKRRVGEIAPSRLQKLLTRLGRERYPDAASLARFHEVLIFLRAFPPNPAVLKTVERLLKAFAQRIAALQKQSADLSILDEEEFSGIAGTSLCAVFQYDQVLWMLEHFPGRVEIDWDGYDKDGQLGITLPRFIPLLEEDSLVEPDVPYQRWLGLASRGRDLAWLIAACKRLPVSVEEKNEIFNSLELPIKLTLGNSPASRTLARGPTRHIHFQTQPLTQRKDVSLIREISRPPLKLKKLSRREGERILDCCREATTVRYRELYGTTLGDPSQVVQASVGRGVEIFLWGLLPDRRMPLRAYHAGFALKNSVPINYYEAIALFDWMEIGFNTYYAYRDGESAWIYAQTLRLLHQVLGVTCISVYPYQLGKDSEEALQSGAFWFYRKLGFRPMRRELAKLMAAEEKKIAANPSYRTPRRTLQKLAEGHVVLELPGSGVGDWDGFSMRKLGFAVQRHMADGFAGDAIKMRRESVARIARLLDVHPKKWTARERKAFENYALVLSLVRDLPRWTKAEKDLLVEIIRAKANASEPTYLRLLRRHTRLREALRHLGRISSRRPS